ncbi:hypothetical protein AN642_03070 [Epulopiscium sp. SCG-B10WGA-EpuloA2]|nr:hypothetical protein AN642_03070 [Epulopiscium sp. SCG-B10WGA-EpuloA2]
MVKILIETLRPNSLYYALGETEALLAILLSNIGILRKNFSESELEILKDQIDDMVEHDYAFLKKLNFIKATGGHDISSSVQSLAGNIFELLKSYI